MILHRKIWVIYLLSLSTLYILHLVSSSTLCENEEKQDASKLFESDLAVNSSFISNSYSSSCNEGECPLDGEEEQDFSPITKAEILEKAMTQGEWTKEFGPDILNDLNVYPEQQAQTPEILPRGLPAIVFLPPRPPPLPDRDIQFFLFTSEKPTVSQKLVAFLDAPWENVQVINGADTIIICHGFMSNPKSGPGEKLREEYLKFYKRQNRPVNIILVDWSSAAKFWQKHSSFFNKIYSSSAASTKTVGLTTNYLIQKLRLRSNITLDQMHLIGHSLGAQAMGYAGKILAKGDNSAKVGRISALDPAAPCFEEGAWLSSFCIGKPQGYESISKNDAQFVDVIHSNTGCFGMTDPVGHVDFYPNGGNHQPGCTVVGFCKLLCAVCSHSRSVDLMAASINGDKRDYRGVLCPTDNKKFNSKACQSNRETKFNFMGHHVGKNEENHGVFYLAI